MPLFLISFFFLLVSVKRYSSGLATACISTKVPAFGARQFFGGSNLTANQRHSLGFVFIFKRERMSTVSSVPLKANYATEMRVSLPHGRCLMSTIQLHQDTQPGIDSHEPPTSDFDCHSNKRNRLGDKYISCVSQDSWVQRRTDPLQNQSLKKCTLSHQACSQEEPLVRRLGTRSNECGPFCTTVLRDVKFFCDQSAN